MTKKPPDPRLDEIAKTLTLIMDISDLSRRQIADRLGGDYGVRRILDGSPELRVRQLLSFADAVEMKPIEIVGIALGDDGTPSPMAVRLHEQSSLLMGVSQRLQVTVAPAPPSLSSLAMPPVPATPATPETPETPPITAVAAASMARPDPTAAAAAVGPSPPAAAPAAGPSAPEPLTAPARRRRPRLGRAT